MSYLKVLTLEEAFRFAGKHRLMKTQFDKGTNKTFYVFEGDWFITSVGDLFVLARAANQNWKSCSLQCVKEIISGQDCLEMQSGHDGLVEVCVHDGVVKAFFDFWDEVVIIDLVEIQDEI